MSQLSKHETSAGVVLGQRRRRWAIITPTLVQRLVFAGMLSYLQTPGVDTMLA